MNRVLICVLIIFVSSCQISKMKADLIVTNATVYTVNGEFSIAESFAVKDGKFLAVGPEKEILSKYSSKKIMDANGQFIYPGFNDAHCHFYGLGMDLLQYADLTDTKSIGEIVQRLKEHRTNVGGNWLLGRGWDQNDWPEKSFPDKADLDKDFPDIPVVLIRVDGHATWCNSKALELAGIDKPIKIQGGDVMVKNGKPSGILIDAAQNLVRKLIPAPDAEMIKKAFLTAQKECFSVGLTSVTDCGLDKEVVLLMDELQQSGTLKMRINAMLAPSKENIDHFVNTGIYKTERLQVNTIKLFADGALGSRGALLLDDYSDDLGNRGLLMSDTDWFRKIIQLAYDKNYQVATHCIGDSANRLMLNLYAEVLKSKNDRRWRIEHAQIVHPDDVRKFADYSIVPSIQATHATSDMYWAEKRLGAEHIKNAYIYQTLLKQNGWLPNGTDFPVEKIDPLLTYFASVYRQDTSGWPENGFQPENALTPEQALRSMTIWAAKAAFQENEKGSIEAGKQADFVILEKDLLKEEKLLIPQIKVQKTVIAGEVVFER